MWSKHVTTDIITKPSSSIRNKFTCENKAVLLIKQSRVIFAIVTVKSRLVTCRISHHILVCRAHERWDLTISSFADSFCQLKMSYMRTCSRYGKDSHMRLEKTLPDICEQSKLMKCPKIMSQITHFIHF